MTRKKDDTDQKLELKRRCLRDDSLKSLDGSLDIVSRRLRQSDQTATRRMVVAGDLQTTPSEREIR